MFAYADETGNSGRNIFDRNEYFRLGAVLSRVDISPAISDVLNPFLEYHGVERVHAHEWPEDVVAELGQEIVAALDEVAPRVTSNSPG